MSRSSKAKEAVEGIAEDIAKKAEPALAGVLSGGKRYVDSETAHRIAAAIARDSDKGAGALRDIAEYAKEARRR